MQQLHAWSYLDPCEGAGEDTLAAVATDAAAGFEGGNWGIGSPLLGATTFGAGGALPMAWATFRISPPSPPAAAESPEVDVPSEVEGPLARRTSWGSPPYRLAIVNDKTYNKNK